MAFTTPNMGLKVWDQPNDIPTTANLVSNFQAIDAHDHTPGKGVPIVTDAFVNGSITATKIAADAVTSNALLDGSMTDAKLVSPMTPVYRMLAHDNAILAGSTSGLWIYGSGTLQPGTGTSSARTVVYISSADLAAGTKATKLRLVLSYTGGTAAYDGGFTTGLYPITSTGGASSGVISYNLGAVVAGSVCTVAGPVGISAKARVVSGDFDLPPNGHYLFGYTYIGVATLGRAVFTEVALQYHHV